MQKESSGKWLSGYRGYFAVWAALLALTAATVALAALDSGAFGNILIASIKTALVVWIFMHLRDEPRLFKIMLLVVVMTLTLIIALTFSDILYR